MRLSVLLPKRVSSSIQNLGSLADEAAASKTLDKSLKDIRASVLEKTVDILSGYRRIFSGSHPPGQLVLPENLKEYSMFMLSLVKSRAFKGGSIFCEPVEKRS